MRFNSKDKQTRNKEKARYYEHWHRKFALFWPVRISPAETVLFDYYYRKNNYYDIDKGKPAGSYEYKGKEEHLLSILNEPDQKV